MPDIDMQAHTETNVHVTTWDTYHITHWGTWDILTTVTHKGEEELHRLTGYTHRLAHTYNHTHTCNQR